jgi:hypothetical protein
LSEDGGRLSKINNDVKSTAGKGAGSGSNETGGGGGGSSFGGDLKLVRTPADVLRALANAKASGRPIGMIEASWQHTVWEN